MRVCIVIKMIIDWSFHEPHNILGMGSFGIVIESPKSEACNQSNNAQFGLPESMAFKYEYGDAGFFHNDIELSVYRYITYIIDRADNTETDLDSVVIKCFAILQYLHPPYPPRNDHDPYIWVAGLNFMPPFIVKPFTDYQTLPRKVFATANDSWIV